jgi:hypothetical protein
VVVNDLVAKVLIGAGIKILMALYGIVLGKGPGLGI